MKKIFHALAVMILLQSCVTFKMYDKQTKKMRLQEYEALVIKLNGEKVQGKKITRIKDKKAPNGFAFKIDDTIIPEKEVFAYQDKKAYYRKFKDEWVKLLRKGKMNLYYYDVYTYSNDRASRGFDDHYVFQKGDGELKELRKHEIAVEIADNSEALHKFNAMYKRGNHYANRSMKLNEIISVIELYNK